MSIDSISLDNFSWEFSPETSLPISVSYNGREITLQEAQFLEDVAWQRIAELVRSQFSPDADLIQALRQDALSFNNQCVSKKWHLWRNITHFCKSHKKEILIALAVIAVVATVATAIIYGASAATGAGAAAAGGSAAGANDCESDKKKGSQPTQNKPISSSGSISPLEIPPLPSLAALEPTTPKTDFGMPSLFVPSTTSQTFLTPIPTTVPLNFTTLPHPSIAPTTPFIPAYPNDPLVDRLLSEQAPPTEIKNTFLELFESYKQSEGEIPCCISANRIPPQRLTSSFSEVVPILGLTLPRGAIGVINGINTKYDELFSRGEFLSLISGNYEIEATYNKSHGSVIDTAEAVFVNYQGYSAPAKLLKQNWEMFDLVHWADPDAKYLQFCHSQGAIHVKNALESAPEHIRNRVIVVAIAPAAIVPRELCFNSFNYASKRDFVPYGEIATHALVTLCPLAAFLTGTDVFADLEHLDQLILLDPVEGAEKFDHPWDSPTFKKPILRHLNDYTEIYGQNL